MKPKGYAISVQWGSGHHYFVRTDCKDPAEAIADAKARQGVLAKKRHKHNLRPTVYVWQRII